MGTTATQKMLLLVDAVYKDISKQMHMDAMYKAADRQEVVDTGKFLNLLDLQLYEEQWVPILARNLKQGNQWLEDSTLENPEVDKDDNFYPPETAAHKIVESDDETSVRVFTEYLITLGQLLRTKRLCAYSL